MNVLFAHWEAFWFNAHYGWLFDLYHPHYPDDNERFNYEMAQCISFWFWPPMIMFD